jgi:hypothetical protein
VNFPLLLGLALTLIVGFFLGFWRGESASGRKVVDYWLTARDGRVNWSRATAAVGLLSFATLQVTFLFVYLERKGVGMTEELFVMIAASLGIAGINLGQYLVSKKLPDAPAPPPDERVSSAQGSVGS